MKLFSILTIILLTLFNGYLHYTTKAKNDMVLQLNRDLQHLIGILDYNVSDKKSALESQLTLRIPENCCKSCIYESLTMIENICGNTQLKDKISLSSYKPISIDDFKVNSDTTFISPLETKQCPYLYIKVPQLNSQMYIQLCSDNYKIDFKLLSIILKTRSPHLQ